MEVQFTPDQQDKLSRMAAAQGCATEALVQQAVERLLHYEEWFLVPDQWPNAASSIAGSCAGGTAPTPRRPRSPE